MNTKALIGAAPASWKPAIRRPARPSPRILLKFIVPLALLGIWQLLVERKVYSPVQLPPPRAVVAAARQLAQLDLLWPNIQVSTERVFWGFAAGSLIAISIGLIVGLSPLVEELVGPTIQALRAVPSLAWVPLLLLWMGIEEGPKITLVAIGVFFPVYTNLVSGIRQVDRKLVEAGRAYGLHGLSLGAQVLLPAALPSLLTGLRLGLAQGWLFLVAAELIASFSGLGYLLIDSQNTGRTDIVILSIVLLALLGKFTDWLLQIGERWLLRWTDTYGK
ncbi:MAG TPA: ABC transporter permease [Thermomicrobiales bacterium]|nr:ABC transporter permease [Thermomicrobiales bacterium]